MNFSEADITALKAKHGNNLTLVEVQVSETQTSEFILAQPSRKVMDLLGHHGIKKDVIAANKVLVSNCVVAGDNALLESDGSVYTTILSEIRKLVATKEIKVKKL